MKLPYSPDFFDSLAFQIARSQKLEMPHVARMLVFIGIDAMSFLSTKGRELSRAAFMSWTSSYLRFPARGITPEEVFKARQMHLPRLLKNTSPRSRARTIEFSDANCTISRSSSAGRTVRMTTDDLVDSFLLGMVNFMAHLRASPESARTAMEQLTAMPYRWRATMAVLADEMARKEQSLNECS